MHRRYRHPHLIIFVSHMLFLVKRPCCSGAVIANSCFPISFMVCERSKCPPPLDCPTRYRRRSEGQSRCPPPLDCPTSYRQRNDGQSLCPPPLDCPTSYRQRSEGQSLCPPPLDCPTSYRQKDEGQSSCPPPLDFPTNYRQISEGQSLCPPPLAFLRATGKDVRGNHCENHSRVGFFAGEPSRRVAPVPE